MNCSLLRLDDIYHPNIVQFYQYSLAVSFALTTFTIPSAVYVILTQIKKAKVFKYILIYQIFWSYMFCAIMFLGGLVPLYPIPAFYMSFVLKPLGVESMGIIVPLCFLILIGETQAYFLVLCYRAIYASAFHRFQDFFEEPKKLLMIAAGLLMIFSGIIIGKLSI
jgi:hypothetical protein